MILRAMDKELTAEAIKTAIGMNSQIVSLVKDPQSMMQDLYRDLTDFRHLLEMGRTVKDQEAHDIERLTSDPAINRLIARYKKMAEDGSYEQMDKQATKILEEYRNRPLANFKPGDKLAWSTNSDKEQIMEAETLDDE